MAIKNVLIAEDDATTRKLLGAIITSWGANPIAVKGGESAWEILECNPRIDLLITDCLMDDLDGRDLVRRVRADGGGHAQLPIIMISGMIKLKEINELLLAGTSRFLPKPIDRKILLDYLNQCLGSQQVGSSVSPPM
jgi:CheY-like chemotaxis protein